MTIETGKKCQKCGDELLNADTGLCGYDKETYVCLTCGAEYEPIFDRTPITVYLFN